MGLDSVDQRPLVGAPTMSQNRGSQNVAICNFLVALNYIRKPVAKSIVNTICANCFIVGQLFVERQTQTPPEHQSPQSPSQNCPRVSQSLL